MLPPNQTPLNSDQILAAIELMQPNWKRIKIYRRLRLPHIDVFLRAVCNEDDCPAGCYPCGGSPWDCIFFDVMTAVNNKVEEARYALNTDALHWQGFEC